MLFEFSVSHALFAKSLEDETVIAFSMPKNGKA
jgi:hypothetical protein